MTYIFVKECNIGKSPYGSLLHLQKIKISQLVIAIFFYAINFFFAKKRCNSIGAAISSIYTNYFSLKLKPMLHSVHCSKCGTSCEVIFRWTRKHPDTGEIIRAKRRPFPIPICSCSSTT